ncbi:MAG: nitronate monooxygenase, partial [Chloroflexi bacterium]|nr:nitronate monooxygenase [Chloroflexota bacterium]
IIQAGVSWVANAVLAAAVSRAGGLGTLAVNAGMPPKGNVIQHLRTLIGKVRRLTSSPFAVHLPLTTPSINELVDLVIAEEVPIVITSRGSPAFYTSLLKDAKVTVLHVVTSVLEAKAAEARGVDAVIAKGYEGGGYVGQNEVPTLVLTPAVVDAVEVPVVAAGGIVDGRGLAAALALGAEAVYMGTRFIATTECVAHRNFKQAIIEAVDTGTTVVGRRNFHVRLLKGKVADKLKSMEGKGASDTALQSYLGTDRARLALLEGDLEKGQPTCGAGAGRISEILPAAEVVQRIVKQVEEVIGSRTK